MKRWLKWILLGVLILAVAAGGTFAWFKLTENKSASFTKLAVAKTVDQEALTKYKEAKAAAEKAAAEKAAAEQAAKEAAEQAAKQKPASSSKLLTYSFAVKGNPSSDFEEFKRLATETLNDSRGWARAGVTFLAVASGGNFTLWLSESGYVASFYPGVCTASWSCSNGRNVVINDMRWAGATDSWNNAGGSLRDYRHMVVNHEVGHFLGHRDNERVCAGAGQLAPLMQQQSMNLRGCIFNPWPLDVELWVKPKN
jgi:predicted ribosomally synthesized peptide with SipW-like signal peptide